MSEDLIARLEWRPIKGWLYEVSRCGRIRNARTGKEITPAKLWTGYLRVTLSNNGRRKGYVIHRLVYEAFVAPLELGKQINHIDANKENNRAENLEQVTAVENIRHSIRLGLSPVGNRHGSKTKPEAVLRGQDGTGAKLKNSDVHRIRHLSALGQTSPQIAERFGIHYSTVWKIVRGITWSHI